MNKIEVKETCKKSILIRKNLESICRKLRLSKENYSCFYRLRIIYGNTMILV